MLSPSADEHVDRLSGLKIRPELNLDYPESDIAEISRHNDGSYEIIATFFGLYGISSPLPGFYTEELLDNEWDEREEAREFLDVIHQHLYPLLYSAWLKYRFSLNAIENNDSRYWEILYSLIGLGSEFRSNAPIANRLLRYAGILSQRPKTLVGLKTILNDCVADVAIDLDPNTTRQVEIVEHQRCLLGKQSNTLGEDGVIGQQVVDRAGKYTIKIGPLSHEQFTALLNDDEEVKFIREVVRLFLAHPLEYEILLELEPGAAMTACLGERNRSVLGRNIWMMQDTNTDYLSLYHS